MNTSEFMLVQRLKEGDEDAFRNLVEKYQDKVYNTCLGFVKNTGDADDLAQEVFIEIYESIPQFEGKSALPTWIYRIAVNKSLEFLRRARRKKRYGILNRLFIGDDARWPVSDYDHPGIQAENREKARILYAAIERLPENQRVAFTLHKLEGLSYDQIAGVMEKSISSVESLMHRAKNNLKKELYAYYKNL